jgi:SAM-dependent methyltransferase
VSIGDVQAATNTCEWVDYIAREFSFIDYQPGQRVLDVGFGHGEQLRRLKTLGCLAVGIEYDSALVAHGRHNGLDVCRAAAEHLPIATASLDGLVCKVVVPYTDEAKAVAEVARVLRPGGEARISYHGLGYSLRYLFTDPNWKRRVYAARVIANTAVYRLSGRRLPSFWGDTVYQSAGRLRRYYERVGLDLIEEHPSPTFAGAPVFIYHRLRKRD